MWRAQAFNFFVPISLQSYLNFVLPIACKSVGNESSTPSADRQPFNVRFLSQVRPNAKGIPSRRTAPGPDRCTADFLRCRDVAVQQRRRKISDRHIIKAMAGLIPGKEFGGINIKREQVPYGVLVFDAGKTTECVGSPWIGMRSRSLIEQVGEPRHHCVISVFLGALHSH